MLEIGKVYPSWGLQWKDFPWKGSVAGTLHSPSTPLGSVSMTAAMQVLKSHFMVQGCGNWLKWLWLVLFYSFRYVEHKTYTVPEAYTKTPVTRVWQAQILCEGAPKKVACELTWWKLELW